MCLEFVEIVANCLYSICLSSVVVLLCAWQLAMCGSYADELLVQYFLFRFNCECRLNLNFSSMIPVLYSATLGLCGCQ